MDSAEYRRFPLFAGKPCVRHRAAFLFVRQIPFGRADNRTTKNTDTWFFQNHDGKTGTAGATNGDVSGPPPSAATKEQKAGSQVNVNVTTGQRTEIRNVIIENKVEPVRPIFSISVGTAVPRTVRLHRLPARVIEIVPQYRDYEYIALADERIIVIDPATYEIVYVLTI